MTVNPYEPPDVKMETLLGDSTFEVDDGTLRYTVDFDDIMAFQKFHFAHSPTMRNQRYGLMVFTASITAAFCVLGLPDVALSYRLAAATVVAALGAITVRAILKWSIARQTRKLLREGSNDGIIGDHELRIDENGLTEITAVNETRHAFSGIARIEETGDHAFIYISTLQAHVVPKNKLACGDVVGFMARIRELVPNETRRTMR